MKWKMGEAVFPEEITDEKIIQAVLSGQEQAFSMLVERYKGLVYTLAYKMVSHRQNAEDISQEAFLKIYRNLAKFNPEKASFSTWAYRITYNLCVDYLRKNQGTLPLEEDFSASTKTLEEEAISAEETRKLYEAIDRLPEEYRVPIVLFHFRGLKYQQICEELDVPMSIVKNRLYRARKLLRRELSGGEN